MVGGRAGGVLAGRKAAGRWKREEQRTTGMHGGPQTWRRVWRGRLCVRQDTAAVAPSIRGVGWGGVGWEGEGGLLDVEGGEGERRGGG